MPRPVPPDRARFGLVLPAVLLLSLIGAAPALAQEATPPDSLVPTAAPPDSLAGTQVAAPDTLGTGSEADSLAQSAAVSDSLAVPDSLRAVVAPPQAPAPQGKPFTQIPLATNYGGRHTLSNLAIAGGVVLIGASFVLGDRANDSYDAYLRETDPAQIDELYDRTVWLDRSASGSLLLGETLVCVGLFGRFLRRPSSPVAWRLEPGRCALSYRF